MATREKAKGDAADSARTKRRSGAGLGFLLDEVRHHLCMSRNPSEDADEIIGLAEKIKTIHDSKESALAPRRKDGPAMLKADIKRPAKPKVATPMLQELIARVVDNPEVWLSTPNPQFGGKEPRQLIGTRDEPKLINLLRAVDLGLF